MKEALHVFFMNRALELAQCAFSAGEIPVGAVIVDENDQIIGEGYNLSESDNCQLKHAELSAIAQATQKRGDWRLEGCWLYVTLEPCIMCLGAIGLSRLSGIVYAARSPEYGGLGLVDMMEAPAYFRHLVIVGGLKEAESIGMLKVFFMKARGEECREPTPGVPNKDKDRSREKA